MKTAVIAIALALPFLLLLFFHWIEGREKRTAARRLAEWSMRAGPHVGAVIYCDGCACWHAPGIESCHDPSWSAGRRV